MKLHFRIWESYSMQNLTQELRYAVRQLSKSPAFSLTVILTLALGIGANTAIFTVVQSLLLKPLEYPEADRIVALNTRWEQKAHSVPRMTGPDLVDIRDQAKTIAAVGFYEGGELGVQLRDHATFVGVTSVNSGFAQVFQIPPLVGRWFTAAESKHAAVVNATFAQNNFGSAEAAVGQIVKVEGQPLDITGVVPGGFEFPNHTQVWMDYPTQPESTSRTAFNYRAVARLGRGVSLDAAQAELAGIGKRLQAAYPKDNEDKSFTVVPLQEQLVGAVRPMLLLLMFSVGLVLLIACVNVTHLYLARAVERQRELAVRTALGSSRMRLGRMVVLESLVLSGTGALLGIAIAEPIVKLLVSIAPSGLPRAGEIQLNLWVFVFTAGIALVATVAAALVPARQAARVDPIRALQQDSSRGMSSRHSFLLRNGLVVAEVAAAFVLAVGASLLARTMLTLQANDLGYSKAGLLIVDADAPAVSLEDSLNATQKFNTIYADLRTLPGVESVAGVMGLPTGKYGSNGYYSVNGAAVNTQGNEQAIFSLASPDYFKTMEVALLKGRDFSAEDAYTAPFVAIISESLARQSFPNQDPIGRQIQCGLDSPKWMTIIGVVRDVRQDSPAESPGPALYMPLAQHPYMATQINIAIRTKVAPASLIDTVQSRIRRIDPGIAIRFTTMDAMVGDSVEMQRFRSVLVGSFAGVGLLLAILGVYGTVSYSVAQRTFEIGVRMAFGAERESILKMVLRQVLVLASIGIVAGLALSLIAGRFIASMLSGVSPADPLSLGAAVGVLMLAAVGAGLIPARAASSVEPMQALRGL
jgi:putative ABC transport system permease protein